MRLSGTNYARAVVCGCTLWLLVVNLAWPKKYHVAPQGEDTNPGSASAPFRTIQQAADMMRPGDVCVIHAGTYRETVRPGRSGTPKAPIRFVAAPGDTVRVIGTQRATNWVLHQGKIYRAAVDWPVDQVFVDDRMMIPARFPNAGRDPYRPTLVTATVEKQICTVEGHRWPDDHWKGGSLWGVGKTGWVFGSAPIRGSQGNTLQLSEKVPFWSKGSGKLLLTGVLAALDSPREWHQRDGWVYFWAPDGVDPNDLGVEVTRRRWAFDLAQRSYVEIKGLHVFAASINMEAADHCTVDGCCIRFASFGRGIRGGFNRDRGMNADSEGLGVVVGGTHNTVRNSVVAYCLGDGISVYGEHNTVRNCVVHDCNLSSSDCAPVNCTGHGHTVAHCTLFNAGRSVLLHRHLRQGRIEHNHIFNAGLMTGDLGATYTFQSDGQGTVIAYNRVHDVRCHTGVGIYIDNGSPNHLVHHNLCYNVTDCGIRINTPTRNVLLYNNTLCRNGKSLAWWGSRGNDDQQGVQVVNNILTDSVSLGKGAVARSNYTGEDPGWLDPKNNDFRLRPDSPCVDAGETIDGITERHVGQAPDLGCFEQGADPWTAGSTLPRKQWGDSSGW